MTTGVLAPNPILQFFDNAGNPMVGGTLLLQVGGVNTAGYSDVGLTTQLPNPITLNSRGEVATAAGASSQLFLSPATTYSMTLSDANGNQIWQATTVTGPLASGNAVESVSSGTNITVDNTDPANPIINAPDVALLTGAAFTGNVSVAGTITNTSTVNFNT
jgi:hypothetical protein